MSLEPLFPAEQNNEVSWYTSGLAGIVSGGIKVVEGAFSLGAELVDLGLDTNTAAQVEIFFDKLNPLEEIAEQTGVGKLTQALVQIGVPGGAGFKLGTKLYNRYFEAKKAGKLVSAGSKNLAKQKQIADKLNKESGIPRFAVGAVGGAAGEAFVADVEEIGSFGDIFDRGPTQLDVFALDGGRQDATRKLMNRLKFGSEAILLTPFAAGIGKGAKAIATRGKELAYSNSRIDRFLNKVAEAFTPEGPLTRSLFGSQKVMEGFRSADLNRATELVKNLDKSISKAFPQMQDALDRSLTKKEKELFYKEINDKVFAKYEADIIAKFKRAGIKPTRKRIDAELDKIGVNQFHVDANMLMKMQIMPKYDGQMITGLKKLHLYYKNAKYKTGANPGLFARDLGAGELTFTGGQMYGMDISGDDSFFMPMGLGLGFAVFTPGVLNTAI